MNGEYDRRFSGMRIVGVRRARVLRKRGERVRWVDNRPSGKARFAWSHKK